MLTVSGSFEDVSGVESGIQMTVVQVTFTVKTIFTNFSAGVYFCGEKFCGIFFFLRELYFADRRKSAKSAKINSRKI